MKEYWYDWGGLNEQIFRFFYLQHPSDFVAWLIGFLHTIASFSALPYWLVSIGFCTVIGTMLNITKRGHSWMQIKRTLVFLGVITFSAFVMIVTINVLKTFFAFPRPYAMFFNVVALVAPTKDVSLQSFPSGHAACATFIVTSLWLHLSGWSKCLGLGFVLAVCWSRVAGGFHFPADVVAGVLISLPLTLLIQSLIYGFFHGTLQKESNVDRRYIH